MKTSSLVIVALLASGCQGSQSVTIGVQPLAVAAGTEVQNCYYLKTPIDQPMQVGHIKVNFAEGTHHVQLYYGAEPHQDGVESCFQAVDFDKWHLLVAAQRDALDWQLPDGVAFELEPQQQLLLQVHYVNVGMLTTAQDRGGGTITMESRPAGEVKQHMGSIFGQQRDIHIAPQSTFSVEGLCTLPREVDMGAFAGHYHFRGKDFIGYKTDLAGVTGAQFYRSDNFSEPAFDVYDVAHPLHFGPGERIMWHCDYDNPTDVEVDFGPREADQEHCNMFAFYYPAATAQEFTPCVSWDRCSTQCTADQTCTMGGQCVAR